MQKIIGLSRLRGLSLLPTLRTFTNKRLDLDQIFGQSLSKEDKLKLKQKVANIQRDSYDHAMPSQLSELAVDMDRLIRKEPKRKPMEPSHSKLLNEGTKASRLLRLEVYSRALSEGLSEMEAREVSDKVVERAAVLFEEKANKTVAEFAKEAEKRKSEEDEMNEKEKKLFDYAFHRVERMFYTQKRRDHREQRANYDSIEPNPNAEKIFGNKQKALNYFDLKNLKPVPTSYWAEMEKRKTDLTNLSSGPTNAFEEQIIWTEQGRMWPYPIDNEYLTGEEENISFTEHIFVDKYLNKYTHLPKTGPVAHFMELVCVGLSKNPYMTLSKKHMHLDSFAEFFNAEHIEKIHKLHEEAERQTR